MRNFLAIKREEYSQSDSRCINWDAMLRRAAMFSRWVASEIVQTVPTQKRIEVIRRFVMMAMRFLENNNFNGLMCVWGGLNTISVYRLTKTRKKLPKQIADIWNALEVKLSEERNFGRIRKVIKSKVQNGEPVVPWFELINKLRNWASQHDDYLQQSSKHGPKLLNFGKIYSVGEQIITFENYKKLLENVDLFYSESNKTDKMIQTYLEHLPTYPDDILWKMSVKCEPNPSENNSEKGGS